MVTQAEIIYEHLKKGLKTIAELFAACEGKILRPNIRRILGEGAKEGELVRLAKGVYTIKQNGKETAWIECGDAREIMQDLVDAGKKFDMIFLDPAYKSDALIGRNRMLKDNWYKFLTVEQFRETCNLAAQLTRTENTPIILMLSGARTAQKDMQKYLTAISNCGFKTIQEGSWEKTYNNKKSVINLRGELAAPERLILLSQSGKADREICLNIKAARPPIAKSYRTQKPAQLIKEIILQTTKENDHILDPFAGSGVVGTEAVRNNRRVTLIEICIQAVEKFIVPQMRYALFYSRQKQLL